MAEMMRAAGTVGLSVEESAARWIVMADDYLHPDVVAWQQVAREHGWSWMLMRCVGTVALIGPVLGADAGCELCLQHRLRGQRIEGLSVDFPLAYLSSGVRAACELAARAALSWDDLIDRLIAFDVDTLTRQLQAVIRVPHCTQCRPSMNNASVLGEPRGVEATIARLSPLVSPYVGVIGAIGVHPLMDIGWRATATWCGVNRTKEMSANALLPEMNRGSCGAAPGRSEAIVGAMAEAVEMYAATWRDDAPHLRVPFADAGDDFIHPNDVMSVSARQYENRQSWNEMWPAKRHQIPQTFDASMICDWTKLWSLTHETARYLPTAYCYLDHPAGFCIADSSGNAAGNTRLAAIIHGWLELVERDAAGIWWYNRIRRAAVDLDAFDDPWFERVRNAHSLRGRTLHVLDLTTDLCVPVFCAVSTCGDEVALGFGAHFDAHRALTRALAETLEALETDEASERPWMMSTSFRVNFDLQPQLEPDPAQPWKGPQDFEPRWSENLEENVRVCVTRAASVGLETLVLDLSRADIPLHVVRVVVPGLRHFSPRFGPGRLYDVPVKMGWLTAPLTEAQMNSPLMC